MKLKNYFFISCVSENKLSQNIVRPAFHRSNSFFFFVINCPAEENARSDSTLVGFMAIQKEYVLSR